VKPKENSMGKDSARASGSTSTTHMSTLWTLVSARSTAFGVIGSLAGTLPPLFGTFPVALGRLKTVGIYY